MSACQRKIRKSERKTQAQKRFRPEVKPSAVCRKSSAENDPPNFRLISGLKHKPCELAMHVK